MPDLMNIEVGRLRRCPIQLYPVLKESLAYMMKSDSIRDLGITDALLVRPKGDGYEVVKGNHEYEIALDLRVPVIPCIVREMNDAEVLRTQLAAQGDIRPTDTECAVRLRTILKVDPSLTLNELATYIRWHPDTVVRIMNLSLLSRDAKEDLAKGRLNVILAAELCKLPKNRQDELLPLLDTPGGEFLEMLREEVRSARGRQRATSSLGPSLRSLKEAKYEYMNPTQAASVLTSMEASTPLEGWKAALAWILKVDTASLAERKHRELRRQEKESAKLHKRIAQSLFGENT